MIPNIARSRLRLCRASRQFTVTAPRCKSGFETVLLHWMSQARARERTLRTASPRSVRFAVCTAQFSHSGSGTSLRAESMGLRAWRCLCPAWGDSAAAPKEPHSLDLLLVALDQKGDSDWVGESVAFGGMLTRTVPMHLRSRRFSPPTNGPVTTHWTRDESVREVCSEIRWPLIAHTIGAL